VLRSASAETLPAAQNQGHHTTDGLDKRGTEKRKHSTICLEKAVVDQINTGTVSKAMLATFLSDIYYPLF